MVVATSIMFTARWSRLEFNPTATPSSLSGIERVIAGLVTVRFPPIQLFGEPSGFRLPAAHKLHLKGVVLALGDFDAPRCGHTVDRACEHHDRGALSGNVDVADP